MVNALILGSTKRSALKPTGCNEDSRQEQKSRIMTCWLVTCLIPGNKHIFRPLLVQVSKIFDADVPTLIPRNVPSKTVSLTDHRAIGRGKEKNKNKEKHKGDASGTAVTISAIKTGNGCSRNILLDTRGMNGHDRSTNIINEKRKKKT